MSDAQHESGSVIDLGGVALPPSGETGPVPFEYPFTHDSEVFFRGVLDGIINTGGMPRLLFVGRAGFGNLAGIAALGLAKAAAERQVDVLVVDASFEEPSLAKPFPYQPDEGLTDMILWGSSLQATLRKTQNERIQVVSVGSPPADPDNILLDHDSDSVLNTLREQAELVLVVSDLHSSEGDFSPLVGRSDRTLIVRGEGDTIGPIREALPAGKVLEITIGNLAAVEDPIDEAALLAAAAADEAAAARTEPTETEAPASSPEPEPELETKPEPELETKPVPKLEPKLEPKPEPKLEPKPEPKHAQSGPDGADAPSKEEISAGALKPPAPAPAPPEPKPSPTAPDPSVGRAIPAYDASKQKKEGSLLGIVGALAGVAAVIGVVGGIWFLQGRFQGVEGIGGGTPAVVAQNEVPAPEGRAALDANGSGAVNQTAAASTGEDREAPAGAGNEGTAAVSTDNDAGPAPAAGETGTPPGAAIDPGDRTIPIQAGTKVVKPTESKPAESAPAVAKPAATVSGRAYGVHVESFPTRNEAEAAAAAYEAAGMPVTIKAVNVPGKGLWHRVILGRVGSKAEADALSREVKERFDLRYTLVVRVDR